MVNVRLLSVVSISLAIFAFSSFLVTTNMYSHSTYYIRHMHPHTDTHTFKYMVYFIQFVVGPTSIVASSQSLLFFSLFFCCVMCTHFIFRNMYSEAFTDSHTHTLNSHTHIFSLSFSLFPSI